MHVAVWENSIYVRILPVMSDRCTDWHTIAQRAFESFSQQAVERSGLYVSLSPQITCVYCDRSGVLRLPPRRGMQGDWDAVGCCGTCAACGCQPRTSWSVAVLTPPRGLAATPAVVQHCAPAWWSPSQTNCSSPPARGSPHLHCSNRITCAQRPRHRVIRPHHETCCSWCGSYHQHHSRAPSPQPTLTPRTH
jgi:hypothetical protein